MDGGRVNGGGSNMPLLLQNERLSCSSEVLESLLMSISSPSFHGDSVSGSTSVVNFEHHPGENVIGMSLFSPLDKDDNGNEDYDRRFHQPGKKRKLGTDQVRFLETSFEVENKLEPERKVQLAKELGLQPRQVAIWFQNRRARYKTKQLEKDYDSLKSSYDKLKADYASLFEENEKLKNEVQVFTDKFLLREKRKGNSEPCNLINILDAEPQKPSPSTISQSVSNVPLVACKQEDASSAKSDVFDSDNPNYNDGNYSSLLEPADSSIVFEYEQSDFSQDDEDNLSRSFLLPLCFPKLEDEFYNGPSASSCNLGFPVEDQAIGSGPTELSFGM